MNWLRRWSVPVSVLLLTLTAIAWCDQAPPAAPDAPGEKWVLDRSLTLMPAPEPQPALAFRLFPLFSDRKAGNAVPIYLRLNHEQNDAARRDWSETPRKWNALPVDKIPLDEAKAFLKKHQNFLRQFELGARRKTAEWDYTLDQGSIIDVLLPDVQQMRGFMPMLVLKIRVELAERNFMAAAHWLETGFSFSQQVGSGPFLINRLVGIAGAALFLDCVQDFVEQPGAPNMYWSVTALPRPLIDLRDALDMEYRTIEMEFPELADLSRPRSPEQWDAMLKKVRMDYQRFADVPEEGGGGHAKIPAGTTPEDAASKSPELAAARKHLIEQKKLAADKVSTMPPAQVLLLYLADTYSIFRDDCFKTTNLPFSEARVAFAEAESRLKAAPESEGKRLASMLLPAIGKVLLSQNRLERRVAALRVIEALRLYAAAHDGKLPDKLSQVTLVPVPDDPGTREPFGYQRDGDTATLTSHIPGTKTEETGLRFKLTMQKK
jgi:hypothetical protein